MTTPWSPRTLARWIGVLVLISLAFGSFGETFVLDQLLVPKDAGALRTILPTTRRCSGSDTRPMSWRACAMRR